jgi:hypothetical protein
MKADDTLSFFGQPTPIATPVTLVQGWNMIPFFGQSSQNVSTALQSLNPNLKFVANRRGKVYLPEFSINQLGTLEPTQGYRIYLSAIDTLVYQSTPRISETDFTELTHQVETRKIVSPVQSHEYFATLILEVPQGEDGSEVGAYNSMGDLISTAVVENGKAVLTLWEEESEALVGSSHGFREGEEIQVLQFDTDIPRALSTSFVRNALTKEVAAMQYSRNQVLVAQTKLAEFTTSELLWSMPNPFSENVTIGFSVKQASRVKIELLTLQGQTILAVIDEEKAIGEYSQSANTSELATGTYFVRLTVGSQTVVLPIVKQQ